MAKKPAVTSRNYKTIGDGNYSLGKGLLLCVRGNSRLWFYRYQVQGKRYQIPVGSAYDFNLTEARLRVNELYLKRMQGDSIVEQTRSLSKGAVPFEAYYEKVAPLITRNRGRSQDRHRYYKRIIKRFALPVFGKKPLRRVDHEDIIAAMEAMGETCPSQVCLLRAHLEEVFGRAKFDGLVKDNVALWKNNLELVAPKIEPAPISHFLAPTLSEMRAICGELRDTHFTSGLLVLFCILTAVRNNEARGARFEEIDFENAVWNIPAKRMKMRRPHRVPLSKQALHILNLVRRDSGVVFVSPWTGAGFKPLSCLNRLRKALRDAEGKEEVGQVSQVTMHGCRATFRDWCESQGVPSTTSEYALSHMPANRTVQAYQRSDLLEQRRPVMQAWADAILPM